MNLPNKLTLLRLVLAVLFVVCLSVSFPWHLTVALALFLLATLTDYLDGEIARRCQLITDFGKLMDPLADKVLTASAFICLIPYGALPAWAVIVIISREFLITGLRLLASSKGIVLPAEKLGKHKTAWQMISILYFLGLLAWKAPAAGSPLFLPQPWQGIGVALVTITVVLTLFSGLAYFWKNRHLLATG
jgi:CDP-diacylglycerol--glycerol-3-phosphate 3-phosphatidyltransferase